MDRKRLTAVVARYDGWCVVCCGDGRLTFEETSLWIGNDSLLLLLDTIAGVWCCARLRAFDKTGRMLAKTKKLWKTVRHSALTDTCICC
jgi:hypothetical protein